MQEQPPSHVKEPLKPFTHGRYVHESANDCGKPRALLCHYSMLHGIWARLWFNDIQDNVRIL
jgi:hypothetical protein